MAKAFSKKKANRKKSAKNKPRAAKKKPTLKSRAKKTGRKVKKAAGTDVGRAGIGAGAGAILLGPIGAAVGAYAGLKTRKKGKKDNPGMPGMVLVRSKSKPRKPPQKTIARDIYRMDSALRNTNERAAQKVYADHREAYSFLERRDINERIAPRNRMYRQVMRLHSVLAQKVPHMAHANPEPMVKISSTMGSLLLDYHKASRDIEHVAASALRGDRVGISHVIKSRDKLVKLQKIQPTAGEREQIGNLVNALDKIIERVRKKNPGVRAFSLETQIKRQRQSKAKEAMGKSSSRSKVAKEVSRKSMKRKIDAATKPNPKATVRKKGKFHKAYVPTAEEARAFERKYGKGTQLDKLTTKYRRARDKWIAVAGRPHSTPGEIARAKKKADDAERRLILYASTIGIDPKEFEVYMEHALTKESVAKTRKRSSNPGLAGNPLKRVTERTPDKKFREAISRNIAIEMHAGKPQKQAIAIAMRTARKQAPTKTRKLYGRAPISNPTPNPCIGLHFHGKDADELLEAAEKSGKRQQKAVKVKGTKKNPKKNPRLPSRGSGFRVTEKMRQEIYRKGFALFKERNGGKTYSELVIITPGPANFGIAATISEVADEFSIKHGLSHNQRYHILEGGSAHAWVLQERARGNGNYKLKWNSRLGRYDRLDAKTGEPLRRRRQSNPKMKAFLRKNPGCDEVYEVRYLIPMSGGFLARSFFTTRASAVRTARKWSNSSHPGSTSKRRAENIRVRIWETASDSSKELIERAGRGINWQAEPNPSKKKVAKKKATKKKRAVQKGKVKKSLSKTMAKRKAKAKKNPSRQAGGFYIVDTRVGKVVAGPYSVREADMTLEESAGYNHATHQVMDERYLADQAFVAKKNPKKKATKKKASKKKVAKKKATKKTPPYQLLINRCHKLWTHYCERPSKVRLEAIYVHLDKMKESTSQKVKTERSKCLRAANAEAKRMKYTRKK